MCALYIFSWRIIMLVYTYKYLRDTLSIINMYIKNNLCNILKHDMFNLILNNAYIVYFIFIKIVFYTSDDTLVQSPFINIILIEYMNVHIAKAIIFSLLTVCNWPEYVRYKQ